MDELEEEIRNLPPDLRKKVIDYIEFIVEKQHPADNKTMKFDWAGALIDIREEYTSLELQKKALDWWTEDV